MIDLTPKNIEKIFYQKIKEITLRAEEESFDYQFSDEWNNNVFKNKFRLSSKSVCL